MIAIKGIATAAEIIILSFWSEQVINIVVNGEELDEAIIKANSLVELLREASELICSLYSGTKDQ